MVNNLFWRNVMTTYFRPYEHARRPDVRVENIGDAKDGNFSVKLPWRTKNAEIILHSDIVIDGPERLDFFSSITRGSRVSFVTQHGLLKSPCHILAILHIGDGTFLVWVERNLIIYNPDTRKGSENVITLELVKTMLRLIECKNFQKVDRIKSELDLISGFGNCNELSGTIVLFRLSDFPESPQLHPYTRRVLSATPQYNEHVYAVAFDEERQLTYKQQCATSRIKER